MEYRKLKDLQKLEGNPRIIKDKEFKTLCDSIRDNPEYFEARPLILSDRTGALVIIAGNQRYSAAKSIGLEEAPTFLMKGLTESQEREIVIRDNISSGKWDMSALSEFWKDLPLSEWGLEIPAGWNDEKSILEKIISEEEYQQAEDLSQKIVDQVKNHIERISKTSPQELNNAMMVIINKGPGNNVIFLSDPNLRDVVDELKRYADTGERSPLEMLTKAVWK